MTLASAITEAADLDAAVELCYARGWSDGLPVIPPTPAAVERVLEYLGGDSARVIGVVPPRNGIATVEKVAVNCVMAGCRPEYVPVVIAALEAMLASDFNLHGVQTTTNGCAPLVMVSGPAVRELDFNTRDCALGHGARANGSIGRAVRLILWNMGGGYPGSPCRTTHGHPGYWSYCIAEDPETNPWEPLHVTRGFAADETVVTVAAVDAPHATNTGALLNPPDEVLTILADAIARLGSNGVLGGDTVLALGPMAATCLAQSGLGKADVASELARRATRPVAELRRHRFIEHLAPDEWRRFEALPDNAAFPYLRSPERLVILVTGSWGAIGGYAAVCPGWGHFGGHAQSRAVHVPRASAGRT
jgi:hypothetical protein